jgi:beta-xylosidase
MTKRNLLFTFLSLFCTCTIFAQKLHSDNGDGTYTNPVICADFPDPDVVLVDDTYYMVTTTMFIFPGVTVLKSKDLVNWEYCSNAVPRFDFSPCYSLDSCSRYRRGQWATSIRHQHGRFHLLFITLDEGGFHCTADRAEGPWNIQKLPRGFYDPGLFYDDNGRLYVVHGYGDIFITEVDSSLAPIKSDSLVFTGDIRGGLEGMHAYKIDHYYYLYGTYGGLDGFQVALRSTNIYGPYEQKVVIRDTTYGPNYGIHQGALIKTRTGEWWTMLFVDSGPFGRFPSLQPVTWEEGWPMVGVHGKAVVRYRKPHAGEEYPIKILPTSDDFSERELGMQWGWNHNPEPAKWSLTENPGYLRLKTVQITSDFKMARNTLTQRLFTYYSDAVPTIGTVKMEFARMKEGDVAGLAIFQDPYAYIAIRKSKGKQYITMALNGVVQDSIETDASVIYFRAMPFFGSGAALLYGGESVPGTGVASFSYSFDGKLFTRIGADLQMQFNLSVFTGNKFCLFNFPTKETGGYVDFDWFKVD